MPPQRNVPIRGWSDGDLVQGYAFLAVKEKRQDKNGKTYLHLELRDASGSVAARVWADSAAIAGDFEACEYVAFEGLVQSYRDSLQLVVRRCRRTRDEDRQYGFDEALLVPSSSEDLGELMARLEALLERHLARPELRRLASETLAVHGEALRYHPAAKAIHHAYRGGLLEHVVSMAELAVAVCDHYRDLDRELVLVGVLFHDLGKLLELGEMPMNDYTPVGRLVGHIVLGRDLLRDRCAAIEGFPPALQLQLEHLVLSHQGHREWGSPVEPMTREAVALHFIDDLDSKLNQLRLASAMAQGFQFLRPLGRYMWLGEDPQPVPGGGEAAVEVPAEGIEVPPGDGLDAALQPLTTLVEPAETGASEEADEESAAVEPRTRLLF